MPNLRDGDVQNIRQKIRTGGDRFIESKKLVSFIDKIAKDKKAEDVVVLDMRRASDLCDYFFICSANSTRQAKAIADALQVALEKKKVRSWHAEGYKEALWIVVDYISVVVHIFYNEIRSFYKLERLWGDVPCVDVSEFKKQRKCKKISSKKAFPT